MRPRIAGILCLQCLRRWYWIRLGLPHVGEIVSGLRQEEQDFFHCCWFDYVFFLLCFFFVCLFDIIEKRSGVTIMMRLQAPLLSFSLWSYCGTFDWRYVFGTFPH